MLCSSAFTPTASKTPTASILLIHEPLRLSGAMVDCRCFSQQQYSSAETLSIYKRMIAKVKNERAYAVAVESDDGDNFLCRGRRGSRLRSSLADGKVMPRLISRAICCWTRLRLPGLFVIRVSYHKIGWTIAVFIVHISSLLLIPLRKVRSSIKC